MSTRVSYSHQQWRTSDGVEILIYDIISKKPPEIVLQSCGVGDQQLAKIIDNCMINENLRCLDLSGNSLGDHSLQSLLALLKANKCVESINLLSNPILQSLSGTGLHPLLHRLLSSFEESKYLRSVCGCTVSKPLLTLMKPLLYDQEAELVKADLRKNTDLKSLALSCNRNSISILSGLDGNKSLVRLLLEGFHAQSLSSTISALLGNCHLRTLQIKWSQKYTDKDMNSLFPWLSNSLASNTYITTLQLDSILSENVFDYLADILEHNQSLLHVALFNLYWTERGIAKLVSSLEKNSTLRLLRIAGQNIASQLVISMITSLQSNPKVKKRNFHLIIRMREDEYLISSIYTVDSSDVLEVGEAIEYQANSQSSVNGEVLAITDDIKYTVLLVTGQVKAGVLPGQIRKSSQSYANTITTVQTVPSTLPNSPHSVAQKPTPPILSPLISNTDSNNLNKAVFHVGENVKVRARGDVITCTGEVKTQLHAQLFRLEVQYNHTKALIMAEIDQIHPSYLNDTDYYEVGYFKRGDYVDVVVDNKFQSPSSLEEFFCAFYVHNKAHFQYKRGRIAHDNRDGTYFVRLESNQDIPAVRGMNLRHNFRKRDSVEVREKASCTWYRGQIIKHEGDGKYSIKYDQQRGNNQEIEINVDSNRLIPQDRQAARLDSMEHWKQLMSSLQNVVRQSNINATSNTSFPKKDTPGVNKSYATPKKESSNHIEHVSPPLDGTEPTTVKEWNAVNLTTSNFSLERRLVYDDYPRTAYDDNDLVPMNSVASPVKSVNQRPESFYSHNVNRSSYFESSQQQEVHQNSPRPTPPSASTIVRSYHKRRIGRAAESIHSPHSHTKDTRYLANMSTAYDNDSLLSVQYCSRFELNENNIIAVKVDPTFATNRTAVLFALQIKNIKLIDRQGSYAQDQDRLVNAKFTNSNLLAYCSITNNGRYIEWLASGNSIDYLTFSLTIANDRMTPLANGTIYIGFQLLVHGVVVSTCDIKQDLVGSSPSLPYSQNSHMQTSILDDLTYGQKPKRMQIVEVIGSEDNSRNLQSFLGYNTARIIADTFKIQLDYIQKRLVGGDLYENIAFSTCKGNEVYDTSANSHGTYFIPQDQYKAHTWSELSLIYNLTNSLNYHDNSIVIMHENYAPLCIEPFKEDKERSMHYSITRYQSLQGAVYFCSKPLLLSLDATLPTSFSLLGSCFDDMETLDSYLPSCMLILPNILQSQMQQSFRYRNPTRQYVSTGFTPVLSQGRTYLQSLNHVGAPQWNLCFYDRNVITHKEITPSASYFIECDLELFTLAAPWSKLTISTILLHQSSQHHNSVDARSLSIMQDLISSLFMLFRLYNDLDSAFANARYQFTDQWYTSAMQALDNYQAGWKNYAPRHVDTAILDIHELVEISVGNPLFESKEMYCIVAEHLKRIISEVDNNWQSHTLVKKYVCSTWNKVGFINAAINTSRSDRLVERNVTNNLSHSTRSSTRGSYQLGNHREIVGKVMDDVSCMLNIPDHHLAQDLALVILEHNLVAWKDCKCFYDNVIKDSFVGNVMVNMKEVLLRELKVPYYLVGSLALYIAKVVEQDRS